MSRHRSPRGRYGETTSLVELSAPLPEQRTADGRTEFGTEFDTEFGTKFGTEFGIEDVWRESATPLLPQPRVSRSGPIPAVDRKPRFAGADDFAAALGLPSIEDSIPIIDQSASEDRKPDSAFQGVTGWRPDSDLVADSTPAQTNTGRAVDDLLTSTGRHAQLDEESWRSVPAPRDSLSTPTGTSTTAPTSDTGERARRWKPVGSFGSPGTGQATSGWTSFGDFQPAADARPTELFAPAVAEPGAAEQPERPRVEATAPDLSAPTRPSADKPAGTAATSAPGTADAKPAAASPKPESTSTKPAAVPAFAPAASFRPAADFDLDGGFEPLAGVTERVDTDSADAPAPTSVLRAGATHRHGRRRPAVRRSGLWITVATASVVAVIVGITAAVGFGKSLWSSPDPASDATHAAPVPAPPILAAPPAAPTPNPAEAPKKPAGPTKQATPAPGGAVDSVMSMANCTKRVSSAAALQQAIAAAAPGQKICAVGNMGGSRLNITRSGTASAPITVIGNGSTAVKGITIEASNVVVGGFTMTNPRAPGIELTGNNITVRNNTVKHPTGGDYDGLRFFGSNLKILNNTITDVNPDGSGAHADCMQTFATDENSPASQNVLISGNRCERIDNQCLIAEGPNSLAGDGSGKGRSANITFSNNFCQVGASQALEIDDVQNVRVTGNTITGTPDKAFSFQNKATGAVVAANKIAAGIGYQVGMDSSSKPGYQGPAIGGEP